MTQINEDKMLYFSSRDAGPNGMPGVHISINDVERNSNYNRTAQGLVDKGLATAELLPKRKGKMVVISDKGRLSLLKRQMDHARQIKDEELLEKRVGQLVDKIAILYTPEQHQVIKDVLSALPEVKHSKADLTESLADLLHDMHLMGLVRYTKRDKSYTNEASPSGKMVQGRVLDGLGGKQPVEALDDSVKERFLSVYSKIPVMEVDFDVPEELQFAKKLVNSGLISMDFEDDSYQFYSLTEAGRQLVEREGGVKVAPPSAEVSQEPLPDNTRSDTPEIPRVFDEMQGLMEYAKQGQALLVELGGEAVAEQVNELHWDYMHDAKKSLYDAVSDIIDIPSAPAMKAQIENDYNDFIVSVIERARGVFTKTPTNAEIEMVSKAILSNESVSVPDNKLKQVIFNQQHKNEVSRSLGR